MHEGFRKENSEALLGFQFPISNFLISESIFPHFNQSNKVLVALHNPKRLKN